MQELETLLNSLIQKGWKPWGIIAEEIHFITTKRFSIHFYEKRIGMETLRNLRELVSLESGLWNFVCSQKLLSDKVDMKDYIEDSYGFQDKPYDKDGFYWVMRCARLEEEELGQFLVDNIKIGGNSK